VNGLPWERDPLLHQTMPHIKVKDATSRLYEYIIAGMFKLETIKEIFIILVIRRRCKCDHSEDVGPDRVSGCQTAGPADYRKIHEYQCSFLKLVS